MIVVVLAHRVDQAAHLDHHLIRGGSHYLGFFRITMLDTEQGEEDGEARVEHDHEEDRFHDRSCRLASDAAGIAFDAQSFTVSTSTMMAANTGALMSRARRSSC